MAIDSVGGSLRPAPAPPPAPTATERREPRAADNDGSDRNAKTATAAFASKTSDRGQVLDIKA